MSRVKRSLSAQLFFGVVLSLLIAAVVFAVFFALGNWVLDRTVFGEPFLNRMTYKQYQSLKEYINNESVTPANLYPLRIWCSRGDKVYLTIYVEDAIIFDSTDTDSGEPSPDEFDIELESDTHEYPIEFNDGTEARAFLYYYAGDAYYYWVIFLSALTAFAVFSLCFITFVHNKLTYIQQLKSELDVLAAGDLEYQVTVKGSDELGELAQGIDHMRSSILEHQANEDKMRLANSQLVTAMSHDLRTPLTSLLAYLELMDRGKYDSPEQLQHFIGRSIEKALQIKSMADRLFEYFFVYSTDQEQPELEPMGALEMLEQFWGEYSFSLESKGFHTSCDFGDIIGKVNINTELLRRLFDNLYSNILKYADPEAPVEFTCAQENGALCITLKNGISPGRDKRESTNIGLSTCSRILLCHGGSFSSCEENDVFKILISLPIVQ